MLEYEPDAVARVYRDLVELQERHGWSGNRMAEELAISPSYWSLLLSGAKPFTLEFGERVARRFPALLGTVNAALAPRGIALV